MQERSEGLGMLKNVQFEREIFASSPVAYITVDYKKLVSDPISCWFCFGRKSVYQEKNEAIRITPKHNDSHETSV